MRSSYTHEQARDAADRDVRYANACLDADDLAGFNTWIELVASTASEDFVAHQAKWAHRRWFALRVAEAVQRRIFFRGLRDYPRVQREEASKLAETPMTRVHYSPLGWHHYGQWSSVAVRDREWRLRREQDAAASATPVQVGRYR